jgi:glycosyltransferase involved in cell wall biosynthesis
MSNQITVRHVIGLVVPAFDRGGLEQVVLNLYRGYKSLGHDCVVLVENNVSGYMTKRLQRKQDVVVFNKDETTFFRTCAVRSVTVLHYHYSVYLLRTMKYLGIYTIYTIHNVYTWLDDEIFRERADQILAADRVVAVSRFVRDYFCVRKGVSFESVDIVPNGVDLSALTPGARITREALGLPPNGFLFANIASWHRNKHQILVIRAAELLLERISDFCVALVGNPADLEYQAEIEARLVNSAARSHIRLVPFVAAEFLNSFYREVVDCVLLPSLQEGCSNVVLEALATDRMMILTDVGNAQEAAALSDRVRIVRPAYPDVQAVSAARIYELSRSNRAPNMQEVVDSMFDFIVNPRAPTRAERLSACLRSIDVSNMVARYADFISAQASLLTLSSPIPSFSD